MKPKTVLLVEDNPDDIKLTERAFKKSHILNELIVVTDGAEAIDYLLGNEKTGRQPAESPALILLDLKLPKVPGLKVLETIRANERTENIPVVILTSSREESDMIQSYKNGCNSFIRKPIEFNEFSDCVRQLSVYWLLLNEVPSLKDTTTASSSCIPCSSPAGEPGG